MLTRWKQLIKSSSDEEEDDGVIPQTAPGAAAPEMEHEDLLPAEQGKIPDLAASSPPEREYQSQNACIDDLLAAVAALVTALKREEDVGAPEQWQDISAAAVSRAWEKDRHGPRKRPPFCRTGGTGFPPNRPPAESAEASRIHSEKEASLH
ncbi:unnamed protein product [Lampetra planeri]